ncbi:hypothetical protein ES707_21930 [subsurface metagenome]
MEEIKRLVCSLSWWFSVVVVGLLVALVKDGLGIFLSHGRKWFSMTRQKRKQQREGLVMLFTVRPEMLRMEVNLCLFGFLRILIILILLLGNFMIRVSGAFGSSETINNGSNLESILMYAISGIVLIFIVMSLVFYESCWRLVFRAYRLKAKLALEEIERTSKGANGKSPGKK